MRAYSICDRGEGLFFRAVLFIGLLLCGLAMAQTSAPGASGNNRLALVIGNDAYLHVPALKNAGNDARLMASTLRKAGFNVTTVGNLNRSSLFDALDTFKGRIRPGDEVVFYFAGHGVQINSNQLLLPIDIEAKNEAQVQRDGVALVDVQDALKNARFAMLVVDACRDNPFPKTGTRAIGAGTRGLLPPEPVTGQVIIMSAGRNQTALDAVPGESLNNGLFTWELAQVIQTPGLEIRSALEMVKNKVDDKAKSVGHEQRPSLVNDLRGNFYFYAPVANVPAPIQSPEFDPEAQVWAAAQSANTAGSYQLYLNNYPKGRFALAAQIRLDALAKPSAVAAQAVGVVPAKPVTAQLPSVPLPAVAVSQTATVAPTPASVPAPKPVAGAVKDCAQCPELVTVPAGTFMMGDTERDNEKPPHRVHVNSFATGRFAVTKAEFAAFVADQKFVTEAERSDGCYGWTGSGWKLDPRYNWRNTGFSQTEDHPVVCVSWNDAKAYAQWLSRLSGKTYRLLTEAEREYVTRAGSQSAYWWGNSVTTAQANYNGSVSYNGSPKGDYRQSTLPVHSFEPNPMGLYNVHGGVWEWVEDCYRPSYRGAPTEGEAWTAGDCNFRVLRGGSWGSAPNLLRSANRGANTPDYRYSDIGFRLARSIAN